jgi:hypothetical protein
MKNKTEEYRIGEDFVRLIHQPGNGTRYEAIGVRLPFREYDGQWLVSFPLLGISHVFQYGGFLAFSYMREKMGFDRRGLGIPEVDLHEMIKLVAIITNKAHNAATDENGRMPSVRLVSSP